MVKENTMKQTEIGLLPEDWEVVSVGNIAEIATGTTPPTNNHKNYGSEYLFVSPADLGKGKYIIDTEKKLSSIGFKIARRYPKNSILFTCIGSTIGKSSISQVELTSNQQINAIFPSDNNSNDFIFYYLKKVAIKIRLAASEQAVPMINKTEFSKIQIPLPPLPEQEAIAEALSDADAWIENLEQLTAKKRLIKQGAMQELLTPKGDWEVKKLGDVCEIIKGKQFNSSLLNEVSPYPCYSGGISPSGYSEKYNELENTIIISEGGNSCGFVNFVTTKFWLGGHCYKVILKDKTAVQNFYYQSLKYNQSTIMGLRVGSGLPNIQKKALSDFDISFPKSLTEQTRIATILSDMDAELEALEAQLGKARKVKQGMMQELLTGRVRLV